MTYEDIKIDIPRDVILILDIFIKNNYEAYAVGGCIRDSLLNRKPKDWDITTNALPTQVIQIFRGLGFKVIETGVKHGTVTILIDGISYEVTTYRIDGEYLDNRHPDKVEFTSSLKEDLSRRDFTVNALAYSKKCGLVDCFNGIEDLKNGIIRCVGEPSKRFLEDYLRTLRCIRFACELNFNIDPNTLNSINPLSELIHKISKERIRDEFCKILLSKNPSSGLRYLELVGLLEKIIPEMKNDTDSSGKKVTKNKNRFDYALGIIDNTPPILELRLAVLLYYINTSQISIEDTYNNEEKCEENKLISDIAVQILKRLRFDNKTINKISKLISEKSIHSNMSKINVKRLINRIGKENVYNLIEFFTAEIKATNQKSEYLEYLFNFKNKVDEILNNKEPLEIKDLDINGKDLMELGFNQGKEIGEKLSKLLELVLEEPSLNTKEQLINRLKQI